MQSGFRPFTLNLDALKYSGDEHADLLYDLATQTVRHFQRYLNDEDTRKVLRCYQRDIARFIHVQMQEHYWEVAAGHEVKVSKGFTELKRSGFAHCAVKVEVETDSGNLLEFTGGKGR